MSTELSWSHYCELLSLKNIEEVKYYIMICEEQNLSVRELRNKIKNNEYERLPKETRNKLIKKEETKVEDFIKNPIMIKNKYNYTDVSEKALQ